MNKLISFKQFSSSKKTKKFPFLSQTSVVMDNKGIPLGFVFGRDAFIAFLETLDETFEKKVKDPEGAFDNPAGNLIDLIEEKIPLKPEFIKDLEDVVRSINV